MRRAKIEGLQTRLASLAARVGLWLAAFALLSQSLAAVAPPMPDDAHAASAQLSALFGPGVVICTQNDGSSAPAHRGECCDECALCQGIAHGAALDLPASVGIRIPLRLFAAALAVVSEPPRRLISRPRFTFPRGPPSPS